MMSAWNRRSLPSRHHAVVGTQYGCHIQERSFRMIHVCPLSRVDAVVAACGAGRLISLLATGTAVTNAPPSRGPCRGRGCGLPSGSSCATRTNCPAASVNGSSSPGRWSWSRNSSWPTSPSPPSTPGSRPNRSRRFTGGRTRVAGLRCVATSGVAVRNRFPKTGQGGPEGTDKAASGRRQTRFIERVGTAFPRTRLSSAY